MNMPLAKKILSTSIVSALALSSLQLHAADAEKTTPSSDDQKGEENIEETYVYGSRRANFTEITEEAQKLVDMPGSFGDPLGAIYSLPGVVYSDGDGGEPAVRGSSPADNIFQVDFLPAGYVFHQFTNSIFHESIIQDFQMYSAGFGPEYSNVTGAAFNITLRDPKAEQFHAIVDASMLRSGIFLESGLWKGGAFYASYRKSLMHLFISEGEEEDGITIEQVPEDDDYQFKFVQDVGENNKLTLSANGASDEAAANFSRESEFVRSNPDFEGDAKLLDRYVGQSVIWDNFGESGRHIKLGVGSLTFDTDVNWGNNFFSNTEEKLDTIKGQIVQPIGKSHTFTLGAASYDYTTKYKYRMIHFVCTEFDPSCDETRRGETEDNSRFDRKEYTAYLNDDWSITDRFTLNIGVQYQENDYTDESFTHPRLAASYIISDSWKISTSYGKYNRFPDIEYVIEGIGNPNLKSPTATHYTVGVENTLQNGWSWTLESYFKELENLPLGLKEEEDPNHQYFSNEVSGEAYGFDLFVNKELTDKFYTWVGLSWAKSKRTNERTDVTQDYNLDTPLVFNWSGNYQLTHNQDIGWRWTIRSGSAYTPIVGVKDNPYFEDETAVLPEYGEPYSDRLPTYSRLDIRYKNEFKIGKYDAAFIVDVINALNQKNVTERSLDYDKVNSPDDDVAIEEEEGRGIFPYLGLRVEF
ncbi:TonB-dependent receptor plug domain-containing protein [Teredinibacter sp. KSP-S5-2]|uniref:TonB-dependent receptor plug domain-containing protein n=1 Tax=Teredinibacter sp. KSP-S5-2 TaxID=3034506 RepID=UPI002934D173|nr:TonB-dependent receptor [Teredinibacter sp. KSP-S5-2]WNO09282.1 TonB-dependent receptor [Teredinibacter sp. KSP-S5-2]